MPNLPTFDPPIPATRPLLPPLEDYQRALGAVWQRRWLTNLGPANEELESRLQAHLGVERLWLFCNGTVALQAAIASLDLPPGSEVVTTPFTFPATVDALHACSLQPVFADIEPSGYGLSPSAVEAAITPKTRAILGLHVYGIPADVEALGQLACLHGLPLVYDAAASFGVTLGGRSVLQHGDLAVLSFHATKTFSTVEGGGVVCANYTLGERVRAQRSFGMGRDGVPRGPGLNGKLSELHAAFGLEVLPRVAAEIDARRRVFERYRKNLADLPVGWQQVPEGCSWNYAYVPIRLDSTAGAPRDLVFQRLYAHGIHARKYFWPLCSDIPPFNQHPSASPTNLPQAVGVASNILCLPQFGDLEDETVDAICEVFRWAYSSPSS